MSESKRYYNLQKRKEREWESKCSRCGACCGVIEGDPCEHLKKVEEGKYVCSIYKNRFGQHRTVSGKLFQCVPLRTILHLSWPGDECCGYKKSDDS